MQAPYSFQAFYLLNVYVLLRNNFIQFNYTQIASCIKIYIKMKTSWSKTYIKKSISISQYWKRYVKTTLTTHPVMVLAWMMSNVCPDGCFQCGRLSGNLDQIIRLTMHNLQFEWSWWIKLPQTFSLKTYSKKFVWNFKKIFKIFINSLKKYSESLFFKQKTLKLLLKEQRVTIALKWNTEAATGGVL